MQIRAKSFLSLLIPLSMYLYISIWNTYPIYIFRTRSSMECLLLWHMNVSCMEIPLEPCIRIHWIMKWRCSNKRIFHELQMYSKCVQCIFEIQFDRNASKLVRLLSFFWEEKEKFALFSRLGWSTWHNSLINKNTKMHLTRIDFIRWWLWEMNVAASCLRKQKCPNDFIMLPFISIWMQLLLAYKSVQHQCVNNIGRSAFSK